MKKVGMVTLQNCLRKDFLGFFFQAPVSINANAFLIRVLQYLVLEGSVKSHP